MFYIYNPNNATKNIRTNKFSKVAGYKINIQNSVALLYTMNYQKEKFRKQSHVQLHKKNKIPRNESSQEIKTCILKTIRHC